jgi:TonB family protein
MRTFTACWAVVALVASAAVARSAEGSITVAAVRKQLGHVQDIREMFRRDLPNMQRDARGRTKLDDVEQWAYTDELDRRVVSLLKDAGKGRSPEEQSALKEANGLLRGAQTRAIEIANYWSHKQAIGWRGEWKRFADTNGLPNDTPNAELTTAEAAMIVQLNAGQFSDAATRSREIESGLRDAIRAASAELMRTRNTTDLTFVPRKTPCATGDGGRGGALANIWRAASPDDYYPPASKRRGEQGDIVVRARIESSNCATAFAIVVRSGYPELDAAALDVAEASRYLAATENGNAVDSELTFKVRFTIK